MEIETQILSNGSDTVSLGQIISYENKTFKDRIPTNLCVKTSSVSMILDGVQLVGNNLQMKLICMHLNNTPLKIPKVYHSEIASFRNLSSSDQCSLRFQQGDQNLRLICKLPVSVIESSSFQERLQSSLKIAGSKINDCLQFSGMSKKINLFRKTLKTSALDLKKNVIDCLEKAKHSVNLEPQIFGVGNSLTRKSILKAYSIEEMKEEDKERKVKTGGYFQVCRSECKIIADKNKETVETEYLAVKKPRLETNIPEETFNEKLDKELQIVKQVKDHTYLGTYFQCEKHPQAIFMKYIPYNLKDYIYCQPLSLSETINLGQQMVHSIKTLHDSGVIHRDLKPQNTLIESLGDKKYLKLIDFGQSYAEGLTLSNAKLGCTMPYSPPECRLESINGINKKQIDLWSILMVLYEMAFRSLPMTFSRIIGKDIIEGWKDPEKFSIFPQIRKCDGVRKVEEIISILIIMGLKVEQRQRPSLGTIFSVLKDLEIFSERCSKLFLSRSY